MDQTQMAEFQQKIQAAQVLGLTVATDYSIVDGQFFTTLKIKSGDTVLEQYPEAQDKAKVLQQLNARKAQLKANITEIDSEIAKIDKVGEVAPAPKPELD